MHTEVTSIDNEAESHALATFLSERINEFNAAATGYFDAKSLAGCIKNEAGEMLAGFSGYTWGGCCVLNNVWVHAQYRGQGMGASLLRCAEVEAVKRGCAQVVLTTHSFQSPLFYERLGYERCCSIAEHPRHHADIIYVKRLVSATDE